jgi:hypothetical protein
VYITSVILLIGYLIATTLGAKIEEKFIAALLDPFGQIALNRVTEYWTWLPARVPTSPAMPTGFPLTR